MKLSLSTISLCVALAIAGPSFGAETATTTAAQKAEMEHFVKSIKADKKKLVAMNMTLTEEEAKAFWPIYDGYQKEIAPLNQRILDGVVSYANAYKAGAIPDDLAKKLTNESIAIAEAEAKLRKTYADKAFKALPATKAARYMQIENKIRAALYFELAAGIPVVE